MKNDQLTKLTAPHQAVVRYLQLRGLKLDVEISFPPYTVDVYLSRYHAAIEVDGPQHDKKKDTGRDLMLLEHYRLPVYRISSADAGHPERWWMEVAIFLNDARPSREHRWRTCEGEVPW